MAIMATNCGCCGDPVLIPMMSGDLYPKQASIRVNIGSGTSCPSGWVVTGGMIALYDSTSGGNWIYKRTGMPNGVEIEVHIQATSYLPIRSVDAGGGYNYDSWYTHRVMYLLITDGVDTVEYENVDDAWVEVTRTDCNTSFDTIMLRRSSYSGDSVFPNSGSMLITEYYHRLLTASPGDDFASVTIADIPSGGSGIYRYPNPCNSGSPCVENDCSDLNSTVTFKATNVDADCDGYVATINNVSTTRDGYYWSWDAYILSQCSPCPPGGIQTWSDAISGAYGSREIRPRMAVSMASYISESRYTETTWLCVIGDAGVIPRNSSCNDGGDTVSIYTTLATDTKPTEARSFPVARLANQGSGYPYLCDFDDVTGSADFA